MSQKIILASSSPRRKELLENAGFDFEVFPSNISEDIEEPDPHKYTKLLSIRKAQKVAEKYPDHLIIAADTMIFVDNQMLGKPNKYNDAYRMLKLLSEKKHAVITGVTIISKEKVSTFSDEAHIELKKLSDSEIASFLSNSSPYDKAGGYSIEELPENFIKSIDGDISTILGLPIHILTKHLKD